MVSFPQLLAHRGIVPNIRLLSLDPGMTTGWCIFNGAQLEQCGQLQTNPDIDPTSIKGLIELAQPDEVVMENYVIYAHKLKQHQGSDIPTLRLIGVIEYLCFSHGIPLTKQIAAQAKGFANDDNLKAWNMFQDSKRHANDSIRHATYYLLFSNPV